MRRNNSRFIYMILVGIIISYLIDFIVKVDGQHHRIIDILTSVVITIVIWEGNLRIDHWLNTRFPWVRQPGKRVLVQLILSMLFSALFIYLCMIGFNRFVCIMPSGPQAVFLGIAMIVGLMVSIILLSIEIGIQFFGHWKSSLVEVEKYKTESLQAQLQNLKNQINPHFLFNNMSVLSSLVYKDQDKAVDFINQLSKVYRYLLDNKDSELVTLREELTFIQSYTYLLQIRFDTNIKFEMEVEEVALKKLVPPMALQILLENAIKHNEISEEQPLTVSIVANEHTVVVSNNLQLRTNTEAGSKMGLKNINDRYRYFTSIPIEIIENATSFTVKIPLLNSK